MKITDLKKKLDEFLKNHGDVEVYLSSGDSSAPLLERNMGFAGGYKSGTGMDWSNIVEKPARVEIFS